MHETLEDRSNRTPVRGSGGQGVKNARRFLAVPRDPSRPRPSLQKGKEKLLEGASVLSEQKEK